MTRPELEGIFHSAFPSGSRYVCDPPVMDTDEDYFVYVHSAEWVEAHNKLLAAGFTPHIEEYRSGEFSSFRKGDLNLILLSSEPFYRATLAATELCKRLNLLKKEDRIETFRVVRNAALGWPEPF